MDLLIDLIVLLIKQATKPRAPTILPPTPQESQRQKEVVARRMQAMRTTLSAQQARTRPAPQRPGAARPGSAGPASWAQPGVRAVVQPVVRTVVASITDAPLARPPVAATRIPGMKLPFLLGEVLGPPVALREPEN